MTYLTLGEVAEYINGRAFKPNEWEDVGLPIIRIQNLTNSTQVINRTSKVFEDKYLVKDGDLLFAWSASLGAHIWHGEDGWLNQHIFKVIPHANIDKMYLYYFLLHVIDELYAKTHGSGMVHITLKPFKSTPIPVPELDVQKQIVETISNLLFKLDEAKEKAQEVVDGFETRKVAILHRAFSGELTAKWREERGVKSNNWELTNLQDVCEKIVCGKTPTEYIAEHGEVPFLKVYNIVDNQIDFETNPQFIPQSIQHGKLKSSVLKPNDVIMNIVGPPLRKIAIIPDTYPEWNMNQAIVRFRPTEGLSHKFLYYALINPETLDDVIAATRGVVGQANISVSQSRSLTINMPSWDEQIEVVKILDCIIEKERDAKDAAIAVIERIDTMKKAILARAFRGELGTNDPSEESAVELLRKTIGEK